MDLLITAFAFGAMSLWAGVVLAPQPKRIPVKVDQSRK